MSKKRTKYQVDHGGRVALRNNQTNKVTKHWPVDVPGLIKSGNYSLVGAPAQPAPEKGPENDGSDGDPYPFAKHTVPQLREWCEAAGLSTEGSKPELITRLEGAKFVPPDADEE